MKKEPQEEVKCVFDSRIYGTMPKSDDDEYLKAMSRGIVEQDCDEGGGGAKKYGKKEAFKEFLNASFNRGPDGLPKKTSKVASYL